VVVTHAQVKEYSLPFLGRKNFRFRQLRRIVGPGKVKDLHLAKAFANPGEGMANFMTQLNHSNPHLREPIIEELRGIDRPDVTHTDRMVLIRRIQEIFLENGLHADFNRPSSVGLVMRTKHLGDVPVHFLIGESGGSAAFCGRYYSPVDGIGARLTVNVTTTASRLVEVMDVMFNDGDTDEDNLERAMMAVKDEVLAEWIPKATFSSDDVPVNMFLFYLTMRASINKLRDLAQECDSPEEFIRKALNRQIDSVVTHETAHDEERKANGEIELAKSAQELIAYLLEGVYAPPETAFRAMLHRKFNLEELMPGLYDDIREKKLGVLLEGPGFLRGRALESVDCIFDELHGKAHNEVINTNRLAAVQNSDYVTAEHMPLVLRSMCNPSLR
jgi:hypothetical protein